MEKPNAAPAEAAPVEETGVTQDITMDGDETPAPETKPAESAAVEEAVEEIVPAEAPVAPIKLKEFRNDKGEIDIDKLETVMVARGGAEQQLADVNALVAKHPELKLAIAKTLKAEGRQLSPEFEALLATPVKPAIKENPAPGAETIENWRAQNYTQPQIDAHLNKHYNALLAAGKHFEAAQFIDTWVTQPKLEATLAARIKAREDGEQQKTIQRSSIDAVRTQCLEAAKVFPKLIVADPASQFGFKITDKPINDWIAKHGNNMTVTEAIRHAAFSLGRLKPKGAAKPGVARTGVQSKPAQAREPKFEGVVQDITIE